MGRSKGNGLAVFGFFKWKENDLVYKFLCLSLLVLLFVNCKKEEVDPFADIDKLVEDEKFEIAKEKIQKKLSTARKKDEILSAKRTSQKRVLELSNDRNRVVWLEDRSIIFRDLANPLIKSMVFPQSPENLSISSEGEFALLLFPLPNNAGCKMMVVSLIEVKESYVSNTYVSCSHHGGISSDGTMIYYFVEDNLYQESISDPKSAKLIVEKKFFEYPFLNIKKKFFIYPIGKTFLIFVGNGGAYYMYWFDPRKNAVEKLVDDVSTPRMYFGFGRNAFFISGTVGNLYLKEIKFTSYGKPQTQRGFSITMAETNPWPTSNLDEFISGQNGQLYLWGPGKAKKNLPLIAERFWVVARDQIIYEDFNGDLVLTNSTFSEDDWHILDLYKQVQKNQLD
jgi:hypothetical protein